MYKNFIWDFDGTLVDTDDSILRCYNLILKKYGIVEDNIKILDMIKRKSKLVAAEYLIEKYKKFDKEEFFKLYDEFDKKSEIYTNIKAIEGAREICTYIKKRGMKNIIITNRGNNTEEILKMLKMDKLFEFVMYYGKDNVYIRKPNKGLFEYVLKKLDLKSEETLSIGDREIDYLASTNCNIDVCLFNALYDNEKIKPKFSINKLIELKEIIGS